MASMTLKVTGMTCQHCAMAVTKALKSVAGVESVQVNLERGDAVVAGSADVDQLIRAVEIGGYRAELRA